MRRALALSVLLLAIPSTPAVAERWSVHSDEEFTEVRFRSEATLEDFEGAGTELSGWIELNPQDAASLSGEFEFQLESLDTGLGLRNKHMRENVLHTEDHPTAHFLIERCSAGRVSSKSAEFAVEGTFSIHGGSKPLTAAVEVWLEGESLHCVAHFELTLADFEIERPKMLMLKVAETVDLTIQTRMVPAQEPDNSKASQ